jgi:hypothetical protein
VHVDAAAILDDADRDLQELEAERAELGLGRCVARWDRGDARCGRTVCMGQNAAVCAPASPGWTSPSAEVLGCLGSGDTHASPEPADPLERYAIASGLLCFTNGSSSTATAHPSLAIPASAAQSHSLYPGGVLCHV